MTKNTIEPRMHSPAIPAQAGIQGPVIPAKAVIQFLRWSSAFRLSLPSRVPRSRSHRRGRASSSVTLFGAGLPTPPKPSTEGLLISSSPVIPANGGNPRNQPASETVLAPDLAIGAAGHAPAPAVYSPPLYFTTGTVFANGCFDIFHAGHVDFLRQCSQLGMRLIVGINSDQSIRALKGPTRPVCTLAERATVLASCRYVDEVHAFNESTPCELIRRLRPEIIVKGPGYSEANMPEAAIVKEWGGQVVILDGPPISSTGIVQRISHSQPAEATNAKSDIPPKESQTPDQNQQLNQFAAPKSS